MSAHWWELWSPGLQAIGGLVEFVGVIVLAFEWGLSMSKEKQLLSEKVASQIMRDMNQTLPVSWQKREDDRDIRETGELLDKRRKSYLRGFFVIAVGVALQVSANGIAWAGAYGLLS